jgi:hypothetical protein
VQFRREDAIRFKVIKGGTRLDSPRSSSLLLVDGRNSIALLGQRVPLLLHVAPAIPDLSSPPNDGPIQLVDPQAGFQLTGCMKMILQRLYTAGGIVRRRLRIQQDDRPMLTDHQLSGVAEH